MPFFQIKSYLNSTVLFEGMYESFKETIEDAVKNNANLSYAHITHKDLSSANIDDAKLSHSKIIGCNLNDSNLSESTLKNAQIESCTLYNTCLAYSNLENCNFLNSDFGATDITSSNISGAYFSTQSALSLNFIDAQFDQPFCYKNTKEEEHFFSTPPIVVLGMESKPVLIKNPSQVIKMQRKVA